MLWDDPQRNSNPAFDPARDLGPGAPGRDLPTTFGETFSAAWSRNTLFSQDYFGENDRAAALDDYLAKVKSLSGEDFKPQLDFSGFGAVGAGALTARGLLDQANAKVAALKQKNPDLDIEPMTYDELEQKAVDKRRKADADFEETISRPRGTGATVGRWLGAGAAGVADPINIAALPIAPEAELGVVASAIRWSAIAGGAGAVGTVLAAPYREQVQPGYIAGGGPLLETAEAAAFGAVGGAAFPAARALGRPVVNRLADAWDRVRGTATWPTSVKDAGNIVSSQANINQSNVYPGIAGSAAHEQALAKTTNDVLAGRPVDVSQHITPELEASARSPAAETARLDAQAAALAAKRPVPIEPAPSLPFERTAAEAAAEERKQAVILDVYDAARQGGFDDIPMAEAGQIADKLIDATPEQAEKIMRDLRMSPRQVADALPRIDPPAEPLPTLVAPITDIHAPDFQTAVRADLDRELVAQPVAPSPPPPKAGSREELGQMLTSGAPTEQLLAHPQIQKAIRETYYDRKPTGTQEDFVNPEWRAKRVYEFRRPDGTVEQVQGWDNAVSRLTELARGFAGGNFRNDRYAIIVLGGPAAGKSTIAEHLAREYGAAIVDPDEAKKVIPSYDEGSGAGATHAESVALTKDVTTKIRADGGNMIFPKVGQSPDIIRPMIAAVKEAGYTVDLAHVSVPVEVAQRRNISRYLQTGRLVDPSYISDVVGTKPRDTAYLLRGEANDFADVNTVTQTVKGTGPLADRIRSRRDVGPGDLGGISGGERAGEEIAPAIEQARERGLAAKPSAAIAEQIKPALERGPPAPERLPDMFIDATGRPQSFEKAMGELDQFKLAADQLAACAAAPAIEGVAA
jgi:predicted kinase